MTAIQSTAVVDTPASTLGEYVETNGQLICDLLRHLGTVCSSTRQLLTINYVNLLREEGQTIRKAEADAIRAHFEQKFEQFLHEVCNGVNDTDLAQDDIDFFVYLCRAINRIQTRINLPAHLHKVITEVFRLRNA